jgi:flagellar basal body-associated protein FliL
MKTGRLSVLALFVFICLAVGSHAGMTSWVGNDGVRHYSNTDAPADNATVRNIEELERQEEKSNIKQKDNERDGFSVLQMYEE